MQILIQTNASIDVQRVVKWAKTVLNYVKLHALPVMRIGLLTCV
jgi:hypothetical protein